MKRLIILGFAAMCAALSLQAQDNPMMRPIPCDPSVKTGKLDNGLTY